MLLSLGKSSLSQTEVLRQATPGTSPFSDLNQVQMHPLLEENPGGNAGP